MIACLPPQLQGLCQKKITTHAKPPLGRSHRKSVEIMTTNLLSYSRMLKRVRTHVLLQSEVPVCHAISLPIPTFRSGTAGYAQFASPLQQNASDAPLQGVPDRWWVLSATSARLISYSLYEVNPFAASIAFEPVAVPPPFAGLEECKQLLQSVQDFADVCVPDFFQRERGNKATRLRLGELLRQQVSRGLESQYRALAPDFFDWLDS